MSKKKKILILILILILLVLILRSAFSKYVNEAVGATSNKIGQWIIKVNNQDITEDVNTFLIDNFTWSENAHVKPPKVAPGMKGHFNITIDPTGTDVALKYTIKIDEKKLREIADINLKITGIKENGVESELKLDDEGNFIIEKEKTLAQIKSDTEAIDNLEIEVTWVDDNTEESNKKDSEVGSVANRKIQMPIEINVIQNT